jgi:membrane-associated PAP2 superfamily phosphatase
MKPSFSFLGIPVTLRPTALGAGILSALIVALITRERRTALSAAAAVLWYAADATHVAGHIVSSQAVGAPMNGVDFGLYPMSVYFDHNVSPQQHIGRACGGVTASLIATLILIALLRKTTDPFVRKVLLIAFLQHGALFSLSLLPIRMVDGGVIYANLAELWRK